MTQQVIDTARLYALNPEYVEAIARGEPWALKHAGRVDSINRGEPEGMRREFDGTRKKWCGAACTHKKGCVTCTLPENARVAQDNRRLGGYHDSNEQDVTAPKGRRRGRNVERGYSGDGTDDDFI